MAKVSDSGEIDTGNFLALLKGGRAAFTALMFAIYNKVVQVGLPNFMGAHVPVPTNLNLRAWGTLAITPEQHRVIEFLTIPSLFIQNHTSVHAHIRDIAVYITTEVEHGAMSGPFNNPPFTLWCQINPLLTHAKKDRTNRMSSWICPGPFLQLPV